MRTLEPPGLRILLETSREGFDLLDVRDSRAFATGHLPGSGHLPHRELEARRSELPPRERMVVVVADHPDASADAAARLAAMGYASVAALAGSLDVFAREPKWWIRGPASPLWRPAPFLAWVLEHHRGLIPAGPAADIAAGAGRDAVFLALQGFEVEAWDRDAEALERAVVLAARHGVRIHTVCSDLERMDPPLPERRYALVACFRFLHRPLFPRLEAALAPGGCLVYETYKVGQERFGRPKSRRHLLGPGELASAFPGLESVVTEELEPDQGPFTARLLARRPPA